MLNCPFGHFHPSYNIECIAIDTFRLVQATPESEMPDQTPDMTYFTNLAGFVRGIKPLQSINDIHFRPPQFPLATHYEKNDETSFCAVNSQCEREGGCECTTVMDVGDNVTVRLVVSAVGEEKRYIHTLCGMYR